MDIEDKYYKLLDKEYHMGLALGKLEEAKRHIEDAKNGSFYVDVNTIIEDTKRNIKFLREQSDKLREELTR